MKRFAHNDIIEILKLERGEEPQARFVHNNLQEMDQRCKWALSMIQAWGMMAALGDLIKVEDETVKHVTPTDLVMRVCEVVDAAWNEMRHRGWIIPMDAFED